jgi:hypothetical protein
MEKIVDDTVKRWTKYKEDFFIIGDATGVLRASFAIGYALFVIEFTGETPNRVNQYNNVNLVQAHLNNLIKKRYSPGTLPGYNYYSVNAQRQPYMSASMVFKKQLIGKPYQELENGMVHAIEEKSAGIPVITKYEDVFKYTGYGPTSKFMGAFFYHSMVMFGWYMFYGWRTSTRKNGKTTAVEFPGSCNVQACINMYLFKKFGYLDKLVYVPHGMSNVSSTGNINPLTAQRAAGVNDVQFCHHGWRLKGAAHNSESGYFPGYKVKVMSSHVDAFDVITLTPIFRAIQRLVRTGKGDRVQYIEMILNKIGISENMKNFVTGHLMSKLSGSAIYSPKLTNVIANTPNVSTLEFRYKTFLKDYNRYMTSSNRSSEALQNLRTTYGVNFNRFRQIRNTAIKEELNKF